jgi:hypothetical protein
MTDSEVDIVTQLNENVKKTLETSLGKGYILQHNANGVPMNVRPGFKFSGKKIPENSNASDHVVNTRTLSHHPFLKRSPDQTQISGIRNNRLKTNIPAKINKKQYGKNELYKTYGQEPKPIHVFAANCKEIDLESNIDNYFVYWKNPPNMDEPITTAEKKMYLGKHLNLWYGETLTMRYNASESLKLYFKCFKSEKNKKLEEIFIMCKKEDLEKTKEDIEKVNVDVDGLEFKIANGIGTIVSKPNENNSDSETNYSDDEFESTSSEADENTSEPKFGGESDDNDIEITKSRIITVHLIEYDSRVHKGGSYIANSMGIISGLFVIAICAIFPR